MASSIAMEQMEKNSSKVLINIWTLKLEGTCDIFHKNQFQSCDLRHCIVLFLGNSFFFNLTVINLTIFFLSILKSKYSLCYQIFYLFWWLIWGGKYNEGILKYLWISNMPYKLVENTVVVERSSFVNDLNYLLVILWYSCSFVHLWGWWPWHHCVVFNLVVGVSACGWLVWCRDEWVCFRGRYTWSKPDNIAETPLDLCSFILNWCYPSLFWYNGAFPGESVLDTPAWSNIDIVGEQSDVTC